MDTNIKNEILCKDTAALLLPPGMFFSEDADRISLSDGRLSLSCDFSHLKRRIRKEALDREALIRAARKKGTDAHSQVVIDATAGFGEDAFLLAAAGFRVKLYEKNPVIALLLSSGLANALLDMDTAAAAGRMQLNCCDSVSAMEALETSVDVIYLDPMFPARKKSGLIGKKFQLLQKLEPPEENEGALLHAAASAGPKRIVVKRPVSAPPLAGAKADFIIPGNSIRFDCYTDTERLLHGI